MLMGLIFKQSKLSYLTNLPYLYLFKWLKYGVCKRDRDRNGQSSAEKQVWSWSRSVSDFCMSCLEGLKWHIYGLLVATLGCGEKVLANSVSHFSIIRPLKVVCKIRFTKESLVGTCSKCELPFKIDTRFWNFVQKIFFVLWRLYVPWRRQIAVVAIKIGISLELSSVTMRRNREKCRQKVWSQKLKNLKPS